MIDFKNKLDEIFKQKLNNKSISAELALEAMVEFFTKQMSQQTEDIHDNDMLLFQYGTYDYFERRRREFCDELYKTNCRSK